MKALQRATRMATSAFHNLNTVSAQNKAFVKALKTPQVYNPSVAQKYTNLVQALPKDNFSPSKVMEDIELNGLEPEEEQQMNIKTTMPLDTKDYDMEAIEVARMKAENHVLICSYIYSAGVAITNKTPYSPTSMQAKLELLTLEAEAMKKDVLEQRRAIDKELHARETQREDMRLYKKTIQERNAQAL